MYATPVPMTPRTTSDQSSFQPGTDDGSRVTPSGVTSMAAITVERVPTTIGWTLRVRWVPSDAPVA